jgi:hypothetical protein
MPETYDVYLVLHPLRTDIARFRTMVQPLARIERDYLGSAEIFYRADTDTALAVLHFTRRAVAHLGEDAIHLLAHRSRLPMIVPACMPTPEHGGSFLEHLRSYELHVPPCCPSIADVPPVAHALDRLVQELAALPRPLALPMLDVTRDLPLFRPWWQRRATSPALDAPGC